MSEKKELIASLKTRISALEAGLSSESDNSLPVLNDALESVCYNPLETDSGFTKQAVGKRIATQGKENLVTDKADEEKQVFQKILRRATVCEQCSAKLHERLLREGFSPEAVDSALQRAVSLGIVDDIRYAEAYAHTRLAAGQGRVGIQADLERCGISILATEELQELLGENDDEYSRAFETLNRKPPRSKNQREGAYRRLMQKGYGSAVAASVARQWAEGRR